MTAAAQTYRTMVLWLSSTERTIATGRLTMAVHSNVVVVADYCPRCYGMAAADAVVYTC